MTATNCHFIFKPIFTDFCEIYATVTSENPSRGGEGGGAEGMTL